MNTDNPQTTTTIHHLSPPQGLSEQEFISLKPFITDYHTYTLSPSQCSSLLAQHIHAPPDIVWSVIRRFDKPQTYKHFIKSCHVADDFVMSVGCTRDVNVISGLPANTSTERLDILDDEKRVMGFTIIGGEHRNTEEETRLFADTFVKLNLQKTGLVTASMARGSDYAAVQIDHL
ncbi:abscisic acid receptor PYR1-like protein [Tanacetum coccineum]